jgi:SAM-dependent methyltransferase
MTATISPCDRWNGPEGQLWVDEHERFDRMGEPLEAALIRAAALRPGARVLDVGCGSGSVTRAAAFEVGPTGSVTGIDCSTPLAALARSRGSNVVIGDAQTYPFERGAYDVIVSRNGLMLFADPAAAFANLRRALRPAGRLAFVTWAEGAANGWSAIPNSAVRAHVPLPDSEPSGPCAFSLSVPARIHGLLRRAGFDDIALQRIDTRLWIASDVTDAIAFFERSGGAHIPEPVRSRVMTTLRASLTPYVEPDGVYLPAAAWVVTAS